MKSREFKKMYHPGMGRYVYKRRGNGLIVDNLIKPLKSVASTVTGEVIKQTPRVNKTHTDKAVMVDEVIEKSGNLIRKRLSQIAPKTQSKGRNRGSITSAKKTQNDTNMLINSLISRS